MAGCYCVGFVCAFRLIGGVLCTQLLVALLGGVVLVYYELFTSCRFTADCSGSVVICLVWVLMFEGGFGVWFPFCVAGWCC